jgi:hypothetical protein
MRTKQKSMRLRLILVLVVALTMVLPPATAAPQESAADDGPGFLTGPNEGAPEDIALAFLAGDVAAQGLDTADVADLHVVSSYASSHTGVTHVNVAQHYQDLEVFGGYATVNVATDGSVVFVGSSLVAGIPAEVSIAAASDASDVAGAESTDALGAVEAAAEALELVAPNDLRVVQDSAPGDEVVVSTGGISDGLIPARLGWQPTDDGLRLAWQVTIDDSSSASLWNATVDADSGELLDVADWTNSSTLSSSGTLERFGVGSSMASAALAAGDIVTPNPVIDGSSYNVYALPKETPYDGPRSIVENPADALASPFGWHDVDGAPGAEHTVTRGNNVHAYTDRDNNGQPDPGSDPDGGPSLTFDFPADLNEHPQTYTDAAVTNLFYWCNVIHDVMYLYGFDDPAGNFQVNNYGRGGSGGDDVRCEAADGGGQNNANFSTPATDGGRPRMQMYLWPGAQFGLPNAVTIETGAAAGTYLAEYARFTPAPTGLGLSGDVVLVDDASGNPNDGCQPYSVPAGSIAFVDDSNSCNFRTQVQNAEDAGAVAVIVANTSGGASPGVMSGSMAPPAQIPAIRISAANSASIKPNLPAEGRVHRNTDRPAIRDGDLEAGIIIHEYGHGISNRLTGGPGTNCLSGNEQMGEGWSDYYAITMLIDPALDDPDGVRGMGPYALFQGSRQGNGIRPRPYSRDMEVQPFTYDRIRTGGWITGGSLATPHGIGHAWAATLWDMTWNLIDRHGFNPNIYEPWDTGGNNLALQLVTDGLKLQGCGPGFVVGRDAIIAADVALTGGDNYCTLWSSFARRGLGYSAIQGTTNRNDNFEAFDVPAACAAPGSGFQGNTSNAPALNVVEAGDTNPLIFNVGGYGADPLASNSPASQEIDCTTLEPLQYAITVPTELADGGEFTSTPVNRYVYPWQTQEGWLGTCRQVIITFDDGKQLRANFEFVDSE